MLICLIIGQYGDHHPNSSLSFFRTLCSADFLPGPCKKPERAREIGRVEGKGGNTERGIGLDIGEQLLGAGHQQDFLPSY